MGALVPPEVSTNRVSLPTGTPAGTVVTISRFVQSPALAMSAVSRPPAVVENTTCPEAALALAPKLLPSMTTVAPIVPDGRVAPFTTMTAGGPEGPVGPLLPPHAASRVPADRVRIVTTRIDDSSQAGYGRAANVASEETKNRFGKPRGRVKIPLRLRCAALARSGGPHIVCDSI